MTRVLVAGIGNIFFGDDGFGPAVAQALRMRAWPDGVEVTDFGIRGMDLAFALTSGIDAAILVDAMPRGQRPGTLTVIEPIAGDSPTIDTHAMHPARVLAFAASIGIPPPYVRVVGVEPEQLEGELSDVVVAAIEPAVDLVRRLVEEARCTS
jgi:hydrogenase maturation protease